MTFSKVEHLLKLNDGVYNHYFLIGGLFLSYLIYRILHTVLDGNNFMQTKYRSRGHTWRSIQCNKSIPYNIHIIKSKAQKAHLCKAQKAHRLICGAGRPLPSKMVEGGDGWSTGHTRERVLSTEAGPYQCTICGKLMLPVVGLFCECCTVSACRRCHWAADRKFKCKPISWPSLKPFHHHWVNVGTLRTESAGNEEELQRFFCSWCQRTRRSPDATIVDNEECDFQKYRNIIIPPASVQIEKGAVKGIKPLQFDEWEPLVILANRKSGSNRSDEVLSLFRGLLNPIQAVDISVTQPESVVRWLPERCRILVAGGDGTVAWVLNALADAPQVKAAVAILPMGTGNDLSRVLGWGAGSPSHLDAHSIINSVKEAVHQPLDRWKVTIKPKRHRLGRLLPDRVVYAYNYASVGVDAQVALDFHHARRQFLYRYANRTLNYIAYACLGVGRALDAGTCEDLEQRMRVECGGRALTLPPLQALVALNIPSWGAGVDLWSMGNDGEVDEQSISDGKLEVVGISSSIHIARLQCGLAEPYRFTQSSNIKIELNSSCAMQVDGEPWMQGPATILIEPAGQRLMLRAHCNHTDE